MEKFSPCNLIGLAPMAGPGDSGFRRICREHGADYTVSEMISAKAICYGADKTALLARYTPEEYPILIQLFGRDPESIYKATQFIVSNFDPAGIDLNMGCPAPKIFNNHEGSALLNEPALACELVQAAKEACSLPISVKMRVGISSFSEQIIVFAKGLEKAGASFLTVHGRTRDEFYSGHADYSSIKRIKDTVSIPVIANGDVVDGPSAKRILEETGADGIALARGALGSPDVFQRIKTYLSCGELVSGTLENRFQLCLRQLQYTVEDKGEEKGCIEFRKHMLSYLKGVERAASFKVAAGQMSSIEDCKKIINDVLSVEKGG